MSARESIRRYAPIMAWLPAYERGWLRVDVLAGLTVWAVLVALSGAPIRGR